jgi:hypothetical protein
VVKAKKLFVAVEKGEHPLAAKQGVVYPLHSLPVYVHVVRGEILESCGFEKRSIAA